MRAAAVLYVLGWMLTVLAAAMLVPTAFAVALDPAPVIEAFLFPAIVIGFVGVNMVIAFRSRDMVIARREGVLLLALVWLLIPLAAALPFYSAGYPNTPVQALFEATSGFTTTGASVFSEFSSLPRAIIVWRGLLQWLGGLTTLVMLAALLGPLWQGGAAGRQLNLSGRRETRSFRPLADALQIILPIYSLITLLCFLGLLLSGLPSFDALCISFSTVSTGGFMPREGTIALYGSTLAEFVVAIFMVLGAVSVLWVRELFSGQWPRGREATEPMLLIICVGIFGLGLTLAMLQSAPLESLMDALDTFALSFATAASLITTTGFMVSDRAHDLIPYMVILTVIAIGGGAFSTSGGVKIFRVLAMLRQIGREIQLLVYPHGVRPSLGGDESEDYRLIMAVWATFVAFAITVAGLAIILAASGLPFEGALLAATSAISNVGPAYEMSRVNDFPDAPSFANMTVWSQAALCFGMILGRAEVVVLLGLLGIVRWRD